MFLFKVGLLTCAFYVVLTFLLYVGLWALAHTKGFMVLYGGKHWFWTLGAKLGAIFGTLWLIAFSAAWCIIYFGLKVRLPVKPN